MRRATGRVGSAGRGALFGVLSRPLACAATDRRANAEARITVRCARLARAARGNHLENIRGTPRKPKKPLWLEEADEIDQSKGKVANLLASVKQSFWLRQPLIIPRHK